MSATQQHLDAGTPDPLPIAPADFLYADTVGLLAMLRGFTDAVNQGDREALAGEMTRDTAPFSWDGDERIRGASSVASMVADHRALVPGADVQFRPPRIVFEHERAWAVINWGWSVSAGEGICELVREDGNWRIAAIDPTGERIARPESDFDPRAAIDALRGVVAYLALLECSLEAAETSPPPVAVGHETLQLESDLARQDEWTGRVHCAAMAVAVCPVSRRALALMEDDGDAPITLELRRAGDGWRLAAVARA
ncbi:hypothetical protein HN371_09700 [Candidatus Poribacteria bacterium]|jgi:hypothetical protein|nr:hypothetical protein [Candidatus Poribacteria bacterium]MBT5536891.1 hypothetical protein [Candidatus Poribacteria bacterium]MBT5714912.1 hypothetical protein [Candidatus Poribacteria bacterium]MBT7097777.1 hypothetical protein [Candidatus Poribacteria bacterium]MBT7809690.1 hypothetical protein [Candidatus Poribacteria bacterium]